jgi:RNA polymerase sigma factor (sigma-70 family)
VRVRSAMTMSSPVRSKGVSDHELLSGFAVGDTEFGQAFMRRFQGRVYGLALNLLGDRGLAEDVAQEAFVRAWKHAATYDPDRASVTAWLLRITRNLAIDTLRRRRPQILDPDGFAALIPVSTATMVEDAAVISDLAGRAHVALARLPPGQARALWLSAFCGCTAQAIADSEGIPLGTAKSRIRQGLRTLRAWLTESDGSSPLGAFPRTGDVVEPVPGRD